MTESKEDFIGPEHVPVFTLYDSKTPGYFLSMAVVGPNSATDILDTTNAPKLSLKSRVGSIVLCTSGIGSLDFTKEQDVEMYAHLIDGAVDTLTKVRADLFEGEDGGPRYDPKAVNIATVDGFIGQ